MYVRTVAAKLADRHERTVAELRAVTQEKEEIARQLEKAKEDAGLLQIPSTDVRMTKIKLGEGAYGGKIQIDSEITNRTTIFPF